MAIPEISSYLPSYAGKQQIMNPVLPTTQTTFLPKRTVDYVNGLEGAQNFALGPNSSALLLDQEQNVLWVVATDQNGSKSLVKGYHIGDEYVPPKPVTLEDLMAQMQSMNERLNKMEESSNGQLYSKSVSQSKSAWSGNSNSAGVSNGKPAAADTK